MAKNCFRTKAPKGMLARVRCAFGHLIHRVISRVVAVSRYPLSVNRNSFG